MDIKEKIDKVLNRGVIAEILPNKEDFEKRLLSDKPMKFYLGADPTSTSLHLGHASNFMLLEDFRKLGHKVVVLFGDFTARIGDPDKGSVRKRLTKEDVLVNVETWLKQITPIVNFKDSDNPAQLVYNNSWLSNLTLEEVSGIASSFTVQNMIERDLFEKRIKENRPLYLHEFFYPLMQGYDSVALDVDVELCGTDQTFNALAGRTLLRKIKGKDKFIVTTNLIANPVTGELMSKSKGTGISLDLSSFDMYKSVISLPEEMIRVVLISNTRLPLRKVDEICSMEILEAKKNTALEIVKIFHGENEAFKSQELFCNGS